MISGAETGCALVPGSPTGTAVDVAVRGSVHPGHAPVPRNAGESLVFRHLYETLVRVDCAGRVRAGLAESWSPEDGGRAWTFVLRGGARFWDGTPVRAADVLESWRAAPVRGSDGRPDGMSESRSSGDVGGGEWAVEVLQVDYRLRLRAAVAESASAIGDRVLRISFGRPESELPPWLADPALAVHRPAEAGAWPLGTGSYRLHGPDWGEVPARVGSSGRVLTAYPVLRVPGDERPILRFRTDSPADARELLDAGIDLLVTEAPATIGYAVTLSAYSAVPLPWDRTYVLLLGGGAWPTDAGPAPETGPTAPGSAAAAFREALARDAVRAEARAAEAPLWWSDGDGCRALGGGRGPGSPRVVYPRGDPVAGDLAERLIALARSASGPGSERPAGVPAWVLSLPPGAASLPARHLLTALRAGSEAAFVFPVPRSTKLPCGGLADFLARPAFRPLPLVDTRRRAIVRRDLVGLSLDGEGNLLLFGAGRAGVALDR
ncbi:MAG: ABC transporter substrate-binding protein [Gemmatimonadota bacterium]